MPAYSKCRRHRPSGRDRAHRDRIHASVARVLGPCGDRLPNEAFALGAFAGQFPRPEDGLGLPTRLGLGRFLVSRHGSWRTPDCFDAFIHCRCDGAFFVGRNHMYRYLRLLCADDGGIFGIEVMIDLEAEPLAG